jgi:hypothetical protein
MFGPNSFVQHARAAQQAELAVRALHVPELLLDIDRPDDLHTFQALHTKTRTHEFLSEAPTDVLAPARNTLAASPQVLVLTSEADHALSVLSDDAVLTPDPQQKHPDRAAGAAHGRHPLWRHSTDRRPAFAMMKPSR